MSLEEQQESIPVNPVETSLGMEFVDDMDFAEWFDNDAAGFEIRQVLLGKVVGITKDFVTVDVGYKSEGRIPVEEFERFEGKPSVNLGDDVEVFLEAPENAEGEVVLSKDKAVKLRVWEDVGHVYEADGTVQGMVVSRIKGGFAVDIGIRAFLPGSQVDLRPVRNMDRLIGETFEFKILKFNKKRGNIVLSRRIMLEQDRAEKREGTLEMLKEGAVIKGHVKNLTDYGAFVDLGGVDGLLHITDMTWGRISHPSEMFNIGEEVEVVVLRFDRETEKVSLGYKQKSSNPWETVMEKYPPGARAHGKIVSLADYGAFFELEPGIEGLIHVSEMSWTRKVRHPSKMFEIGDKVEAMVKEIDVDRKRISLSIKEIEANPWDVIHEKYPVGSVVVGKVRNITDFGVFVGIEDGVDGLVHVSDLSWSQRQRKPSNFTNKGDEIEVKVLGIDSEKERISLGVKQLTSDPWKSLEEQVHLNEEVDGRVVNVTDFGIFVEVMEGVEGLIHISELEPSGGKEPSTSDHRVNSVVRSKVLKIDVDERRLGLSLVEVIEEAPSENPAAAAVREAVEEAENLAAGDGDGSGDDAKPAGEQATPESPTATRQ